MTSLISSFTNIFASCSTKIAAEAQHGLIAQVIKDVIFSLRPGASVEGTPAQRIDDAVEMSVG